MDETLVRLVLVAGALLVAFSVAIAVRVKNSARARSIEAPGLAPGLYFFSSQDCDGCQTARAALEDALGPEGFVELSWERSPLEFSTLQVEEVPASLVVGPEGRATLYPGQPYEALRALSP